MFGSCLVEVSADYGKRETEARGRWSCALVCLRQTGEESEVCSTISTSTNLMQIAERSDDNAVPREDFPRDSLAYFPGRSVYGVF